VGPAVCGQGQKLGEQCRERACAGGDCLGVGERTEHPANRRRFPARRAEQSVSRPSHSLLSFIPADPELLLDDVVITAILIAVAGHETTANLLGAAMIRLLTPMPDGTRIVDCLDPADPSLITELLRLDSPVQATARTATEDQRIGNAQIAQGQQVLVLVAAANRDPAIFGA